MKSIGEIERILSVVDLDDKEAMRHAIETAACSLQTLRNAKQHIGPMSNTDAFALADSYRDSALVALETDEQVTTAALQGMAVDRDELAARCNLLEATMLEAGKELQQMGGLPPLRRIHAIANDLLGAPNA